MIAEAAELLFGARCSFGKMCVRAWPVGVVATSGTLARLEGLGCADVFLMCLRRRRGDYSILFRILIYANTWLR